MAKHTSALTSGSVHVSGAHIGKQESSASEKGVFFSFNLHSRQECGDCSPLTPTSSCLHTGGGNSHLEQHTGCTGLTILDSLLNTLFYLRAELLGQLFISRVEHLKIHTVFNAVSLSPMATADSCLRTKPAVRPSLRVSTSLRSSVRDNVSFYGAKRLHHRGALPPWPSAPLQQRLSPAVSQTDNASVKNSPASFLSSCAVFCFGEQGE